MVKKVSLQDKTRRVTFWYDEDYELNPATLKFSTQVRIADAVEVIAESSKVMARNYAQMQTDLEYYKNRCRALETQKKALERSNSALRGVVTRHKNKQK